MEHIKLFENFDGKNLYDICKKYISSSNIFKRMGELVKNNGITVEFLDVPDLEVSACLNSRKSTLKNIVIEFIPKEKDDATMAHELVHALQLIEKNMSFDIFTNDATREFEDLSDDDYWKEFMMAIYMSDPIEMEAQIEEMKWGVNKMQKRISSWIDSNTPESITTRILNIKPNKNEFGLESFVDFPDLWIDCYIDYQEGKNLDPKLIDLKGCSMKEFVEYYFKKFIEFSKNVKK